MPTLWLESNPNLFYEHEIPAIDPHFFNAPKIGSTPILLQEGTDSFFTQVLFGANVISQKNKIKTINRNWLSYITVVLHTKKN